jgi:hypothetical protein
MMVDICCLEELNHNGLGNKNRLNGSERVKCLFFAKISGFMEDIKVDSMTANMPKE